MHNNFNLQLLHEKGQIVRQLPGGGGGGGGGEGILSHIIKLLIVIPKHLFVGLPNVETRRFNPLSTGVFFCYIPFSVDNS